MRTEDVDRLQRHSARSAAPGRLLRSVDSATFEGRWQRLRRRLHFRALTACWPLATGRVDLDWIIGLLATSAAVRERHGDWLAPLWLYLLLLLAGWLPGLLAIVEIPLVGPQHPPARAHRKRGHGDAPQRAAAIHRGGTLRAAAAEQGSHRRSLRVAAEVPGAAALARLFRNHRAGATAWTNRI